VSDVEAPPYPWTDPVPEITAIRRAAREALERLGNEDPPEEAIPNTTRIAISREHTSHRIRDPKVIAAADPVKFHPALGVRCRCGKGLGWVAICTLSTGIIIVHSDKRQPERYRHGGYSDLAPVGGDGARMFTLSDWNHELASGIGAVRGSSPLGGLFGEGTPGVMFDVGSRVIYTCPKCARTHTLRNDVAVRRYLESVANGGTEIRLGGVPTTR
jgi:hypothetical protein